MKLLKGHGKTMKHVSQISCCADQDSKRATSEYDSRALLTTGSVCPPKQKLTRALHKRRYPIKITSVTVDDSQDLS
jgi:hypothetical protein